MRLVLSLAALVCLCGSASAQTYLACDGSTDNTATIQNAIEVSGTGNPIDLRDGSSLGMPCMTKGLTMKSNRQLECHRLSLKLLPNTNASMFTTQNFSTLKNSGMPYGSGNWSVKNCDLDGNRSTNTAGNGFDIYGYQYELSGNTVHDFAGDGLWSQWSDTPGCPYQDGTTTVIPYGCMEAVVHHNKFFHNGGWGMNWQGPHDSVIDTVWNFENNQAGGQKGGFVLNDGSLRISHMHNYGLSDAYEFVFYVGLDFGLDLYGEGASVAQFYVGGASIIPFLIATNCGNADGVQLTGAGTSSFIAGGACNTNWLTAGTGAIQINGPQVGMVPPNVTVGQNGVYQNNFAGVGGCTAGIKSDSNGTFHC